jgi:CheY-like chemotaxis protein
MADNINILWADDEIELLKPQLFFLEKKGYSVVTVSNGYDAIDYIKNNKNIDVVFLDESMPGITGLETLVTVKQILPQAPVVMITKNEAENLMEEAIGSQIDDYLIKPVNPNQILLTLKKLIDNKRLISEKTASNYQQEFRNILMQINDNPSYERWVEIYRNIISWELKIDENNLSDMKEILEMQKSEANKEFSKFIVSNYLLWMKKNEGPLKSPDIIRHFVLPSITEQKPIVFLLMDNLRYDQWKVIEPIISDLYAIENENYFYSILPTTTQYSRNSIFAGLMPRDIEKKYPDWWLNDNEEGGKNLKEDELLTEQVKRLTRKDLKIEYYKVTNTSSSKNLLDNILNVINTDITAIVYNFIDALSHSRTEMEVLKELASDEKAYRSLTKSWFINSPLWQALQKLSNKDIILFITTDHGTIRVNQPSKVVGDKETTTNLRYKVGKNLQYEKKDVLEIKDPHEVGLPKPNVSSTFIFSKEDSFFLYPNNYNYFHNFYKNTFQHGGISLEEMICPIIKLTPKSKTLK